LIILTRYDGTKISQKHNTLVYTARINEKDIITFYIIMSY